ncbi:MAG: UDP-glucose 4-epimerase GalE [Bacteroidota bacterium]
MKKVLVTGGCGYIGSHTIIDLIDNGFEVISVDNLVNSDLKPLEYIQQITGKSVTHYSTDLCDKEGTRQIFKDHPDIVGIIHFAALKAVGESVEQPLRYYDNNLNSLINVLSLSLEYDIANFIFSSSCSVYGNASELPVTEHTPLQAAESPYAHTKQIGEGIIQAFCHKHASSQAVILRYFNPAGAHESGLIGESPVNVALNLVPVITETAIGKRSSMMVYGDDYDTRDGSCVRDYIHIMDLANAHTKSLQYLLAEKNSKNCSIFNLGLGDGATVLEAINAFEKVTGQQLNYQIGPRRPGDVVAIYANNDLANRELDWKPQRRIEEIMKSAWEWEKRRSAMVASS